MKYIPCCCLLLLSSILTQAQSDVNSLRKGNEAYHKGYYDIAEQYYSRAANGQFAAQATFNIGNTQYQQQQYEKAAQTFTQSAQNLPQPTQQANAHYNAGNALLKAGKIDESIAAYKNALRRNPNDADAKYNLSYAQKIKQQQQKQDQQQQGQDQQNQDKQDQQQQGQDSQNQDQQQQQGQDQQNQDKQDQQQQGQDSQNQDQQQKNGQQEQSSEEGQNSPQDESMIQGGQIRRMSKQEATRLLEAMRLEELKVQQRVRQHQAKGKTAAKGGKDW